MVEEVPHAGPHQALPPDVARQLRGVSEEWASVKSPAARRSWFVLRPPMFEHELPGALVARAPSLAARP